MNKKNISLPKIYKRGADASFIIILLGLIELLIFQGANKPNTLNILHLFYQALHFSPYATMYTGLILLISTPIAVLLAILTISIIQKSIKEIALSSIILVIIIIAIIFGIR
ncbi:DUF1634 domain-containing protein [Deferribacteraceae bacterium V6Fe1]|nr:DUF1634 domain-containing protein [Deferribacteraceae bacterium V6Fe1]